MEVTPLVWFIQIFILLLWISIGHSIVIYRIHREENRKKELELALLEKSADLMSQGKLIARDIEDALYSAKIRQEIDDILRKS
ncbi:MAG: hypothetical protein MUF22_06965 [Chitinispirillaceae bacterium]|nr:hypothetical protein [Chitinispirillaceae bacterium]